MIAGVCVASMIVCCALAWWQWQRFSSAGGSFLNLGYTLQWPLFGLFPAFMFWRLHRLRARADAEGTAEPATREPARDAPDDSPDAPGDRPAPARQQTTRPRLPGPAPDAEDEDDEELAAYNRYLAELNAAQAQRQR